MKPVTAALFCIVFTLGLSSYASAEPQTIDPKLDQALLTRLGMWSPGQPVPDNFNILIVGQDDAAVAGRPRANLSSRSDIIMVLSVNRVARKLNILSVYRDHSPAGGCEARIGLAPNDKVNGVYSIQGRRGFIPCIEGMLEEMAGYLPRSTAAEILDRNGRLKINAFFEGTRSQTIKPLSQDIIGVVSQNKAKMLSTFGIGQTSAALAVIMGGMVTGNGPGYLLGSALSEEEAKKLVDPKYLSIELKERKIYPAGGYQRAFNFASSTGVILGWAAYGVAQWKTEGFEFFGKLFGEAVNKNMSRSVDFVSLEKEVFMRNGDHLLLPACFKKGKSPIRIIQWGERADVYSIYADGRFSHPQSPSLLKSMKFVDILPEPSDCN